MSRHKKYFDNCKHPFIPKWLNVALMKLLFDIQQNDGLANLESETVVFQLEQKIETVLLNHEKKQIGI